MVAYHKDTECLFTTVQNTSGATRTFSYLGAHGKRLAANEVFTQPGDLTTKLGNTLSQRRFNALQGSLKRGSLTIISTPAVHLYDHVLDETRVLSLKNGRLGTVDPCWIADSLSSSAA